MAAPLPTELAREVRRTLADLRSAHLAATAWPVVAGDVGRLAKAVEQGDDELVRKALVPVAQATFEGRVRGRLAGANRAAAYVKTGGPGPAGPLLVGAAVVLGGAAAAAAYAIAGVPAAAVVAALALVVVVAVVRAVSAPGAVERRQRQAMAPTMERTEPIPKVVAEALQRIEAGLDAGASS